MAEQSRTTPPFRADHVGSLLRPERLIEARRDHAKGDITTEALRQIEDECILEAIALQEGIGLKSITDGEFRRAYWHLDFLDDFDGIDISTETYSQAFSGGATVSTAYTARKISAHAGTMRAHFRFVKDHTRETAKLSIPGPGMAHLRGGRRAVSRDAYPDIEAFWHDLAEAYKKEVAALWEAGCTYLQFDDVSFAYLCDTNFRAQAAVEGEDADDLLETYARVTSEVAGSRPDGMTVTTHMCRGNNRSTWMAEGSYEPVAEALFEGLDVDGYFMEYDTERAGGFEPLRFLPPDKIVVLGLVTTKTPELESKGELKRRIDEAARFVPMENICLSPQCGFASVELGNLISEDDQRRKLERVVEVAEEVWGSA